MEFTWPFMLGFLVLLPVLAVVYVLIQRRRQRHIVPYTNLSLVKEAMGKGPGLKRHVPPMMMLAALGIMIVATARPFAVVRVPGQDSTVILTIDVSGSMAADDLKPSRMEAAKAAARTFVDRQPDGVQMAVISFSDEASVIQAPTTNREAVLAAIDRLQPEGGTAIGSAIKTSLATLLGPSYQPGPAASGSIDQSAAGAAAPDPNALNVGGAISGGPASYNSGFVVLLTDGENTWGPPPVDSAQDAVTKGVRVYTVGVGSPQGSILHINGQSLRAGLDEPSLKQIASMTGGKYYNALNENDLKSIYENLSSRLVLKTERTEITAGFTAGAAVLSMLAGLLSMLWFNRFP